MTDQAWSMIVGLAVVISLRMLDWAFPKGYVWKKVHDWSVPADPDKGDDDE